MNADLCLVVLACCVTACMLNILNYGIGVLHVSLVVLYPLHETMVSFAGALFLSQLFLVGPVTSLIIDKFSCGTSIMASGVVIAVGLCTTSLVDSVVWLLLTYGVVAGFGVGLGFTPIFVIIGQRFGRRRNIVLGIVSFCGGLGSFISGPIIQALIDKYGVYGAFQILGGVSLNMLATGMLIRPKERKTFQEIIITCDEEDVKLTEMPGKMRNVEEEDVVHCDYEISQDLRTENSQTKCEENIPDDIIDETTSLNQSNPEINTANETERNNMAKRVNKDTPMSKFSLFKDKAFLLISGQTMLWHISLSMVLYYLPKFAIYKGSTPSEAAILITMFGVANALNRVLVGFAIGPGGLDPILINLGSNGLAGLCTLLLPALTNSYVTNSIFCVIFGLYTGSLTAMIAPLCVHVVGLERLSFALGIVHFLSGVGLLIGPPLANAIIHSVEGHVYSYMFFTAGIFFILAAVLTSLTSIWQGHNLTRC